jgi:hypothetical protein
LTKTTDAFQTTVQRSTPQEPALNVCLAFTLTETLVASLYL